MLFAWKIKADLFESDSFSNSDFVKKGTASGSSAKLRVSISTKIEQFPSELNFPTIGMSGIGWPTKQ
ncbi:MAG: hypothetical protein CMI23_01930 [Opitutae bacterium]|nr:hypothetical protein [Opitutae bacterium]